MSDTPTVETRLTDGVNVIRLVRENKKNALDAATYEAVSAAFEAGERSPDAAAHVLLGSPGAFCAGNDLGDFRAGGAGDIDADPRLQPVLRFLRLLPMLRKPIVAGVDGLAIGIGTTLLFHCDLVYASGRAQFATPFVDLGLVPEAGASLLVPRRLGYARAFELLILGETFSAERMREAGLVNAVVDADAVSDTAMAAARRLAAKPRAALAISRSLVRGDIADLGERIEAEIRLFKDRLKSTEAQGAVEAFLHRGNGAANGEG